MVVFGDFEYQILTNRDAVYRALEDLEAVYPLTHWKLSENCRNFPLIGNTAVKLSGIRETVYTDFLRSGGGGWNYDIYFYDDEVAQCGKLVSWLNEVQSMGYRPEEITVLSFRAVNVSAAEKLISEGHELEPAWKMKGTISCASIHAFKGMENKVIFITDVVLDDRGLHRDLFYTGITRGTEIVRILCEKDSKNTLVNGISGGSQR